MKQPIAIYSSWKRTIPQIFLAAVLTLIMLGIFPDTNKHLAVIASLGIYFSYLFLTRYLIASSHRRGMIALGKNEFEKSLSEFEKSFEYFTNNKWLDNWRGFIFLSPSMWSYREMALMNIAAVYSKQQNIDMYRKSTERLLNEYPDNIRGQNSLEFLDAVENQDKTE